MKRVVLVLMVVVVAMPQPALAKSFFEQLLESAVTGNSNSNSNSGNGQAYRALQDRSQTLREDEQRLDEAYSQLRQKQAGGQDTTADMQNIQNLEATYNGRKQQVRELQWQAQREQDYARQQNYQQQQYQNQNGNYSNNGYNNQNSYNNGYQQNSGGNNGWNNDPYANQGDYQNSDSNDDNGFKIRFGS